MPHQAKLPEETVAEHPSPANDPTVINLAEPGIDFDDDPGPVSAPLRFGRLALWVASATALGIGVLGTVAYGMWFNHDQRVYAEAMASARRTLGIDQPVIAANTQSSGAVETPAMTPPGYTSTYAPADAPPSPADTASLADNAPTADATDQTTVGNLSSDGSDIAGAAALATAAAASAQAQADAQAGAQTPPTQSQAESQQADGPPVQSAAAPRRGNGSATQQVAANRASQQARRHQAHAKPEAGLFARVGAFFHRVSYRRNVPNNQREEYSRP